MNKITCFLLVLLSGEAHADRIADAKRLVDRHIHQLERLGADAMREDSLAPGMATNAVTAQTPPRDAAAAVERERMKRIHKMIDEERRAMKRLSPLEIKEVQAYAAEQFGSHDLDKAVIFLMPCPEPPCGGHPDHQPAPQPAPNAPQPVGPFYAWQFFIFGGTKCCYDGTPDARFFTTGSFDCSKGMVIQGCTTTRR